MKRLALLSQVALMAVVGCQKQETNPNDEAAGEGSNTLSPGVASVEQSDSEEVAVSGSLAINLDLKLADSETKLLAFEMLGSDPKGKPTEVDLDEDGNFTYTAPRALEDLDFLKGVLEKGSADDEELKRIAEIFDASLKEIKRYYKEQKKEVFAHIEEFVKKFELLGGSSTVLVAYEASGDKVEEAKSFKFIGMSAGDDNLSLLPMAAMKGNVSLGEIELGSSDDAKSELNATDALDMEEDAINELAKTDDLLKALRNKHMNENWNAQPFYMWITTIDSYDDMSSFQKPSAAKYNGVGFYVGSEGDTPFVYEDICAESDSARKKIEFIPPKKIKVADYNGNETEISSISNAKEITQDTQGDTRICGGNGFYAREDEERSFMVNFGAGGGVVGELPEGIWTLKYNSKAIGWFDVNSGSPFNSDGDLRVYMPAGKLNFSSGKVTGGAVKVYSFDGKDFNQVTDFTTLKRLTSDWYGSVTTISGNEELRGMLEFDDDEGVLTFKLEEAVNTDDVGAVAYSYMIGESNFRVEYRRDQN